MYRPGGIVRPTGTMRSMGSIRPVTIPVSRGSISHALAQGRSYGTGPSVSSFSTGPSSGGLTTRAQLPKPTQPRFPPPMMVGGMKRKIDMVSGGQGQGGPKAKAVMIAKSRIGPVKPGPIKPGLVRPYQVGTKISGKGPSKMVTGIHVTSPAATMGQTARPPGNKGIGVSSMIRKPISASSMPTGTNRALLIAQQAARSTSNGKMGPQQAQQASIAKAGIGVKGPPTGGAGVRSGSSVIVGGKGNPGAAGAGARGESSSSAEAVKHAVRLRKVEALSRQMLDEWSALPQDKKEEAFISIAAKFVERVPAECLALMAEQFANAAEAEGETGSHNNDIESGTPLQAKDENMEAAPEDEGVENFGVENDPEGPMECDRFAEPMRQLLYECSHKPLKEWIEAWSNVVSSPDDECSALMALCETALRGGSDVELVPKMIMELLKCKRIEHKNVVQMLHMLAGKLEEFVEVNENAWHLHSHMLLFLFPKTATSLWGYLEKNWNWIQWWQMTEQVLKSADPFRAFDILVLVLQMMQEKSGAVINQQQIWKEAGRTAKVRKVLCGWGEMDDASILETVSAYGVEL